jgi:hypothetical protein
MSRDANPPVRIGTQGWKQFLTSKKEMLDAFDRAKEKTRLHEVATYHGTVAEFEFREWLSSFLPKKYGVTAGYIVSQGARDNIKAPHFDVIIYDQHESPVLWVESHPGLSEHGKSCAIPAEYVHGVIEVKSSFDSSTATKAIEHLFDLEPLLTGIDTANERYKKYLPLGFFSAIVFFELRKENEFSKAALNNLIPNKELRGYYGGIVLRGEGLDSDKTGQVKMLHSETQIESTVGKTKESLITGSPLADSRAYKDHYHLGAMLMWNETYFAQFAFDMVALMSGAYRGGMISSLHGFSWMNPDRNKEED